MLLEFAESILFEADEEQVGGQESGGVPLAGGLAQLESGVGAALTLFEVPGEDGAGGRRCPHQPAECGLPEFLGETLGRLEAAVGLLHVTGRGQDAAAQPQRLGSDEGVVEALGQRQKLLSVGEELVQGVGEIGW